MPLQVALMGSWHGFPTFSYIQFLQQALFLSLPMTQEHQHTMNVGAQVTGPTVKQCNISFIKDEQKHIPIKSHTRALYLHCFEGRSLQSNVQQRSVWRWTRPGSHSSPSSTREFPHTLLFLSLKHEGPLCLRLFTIDILLQLENS